MSKYQTQKELARAKAINEQLSNYNKALSYMDLSIMQDKFYKLGKKYGLLKEFKQNGII